MSLVPRVGARPFALDDLVALIASRAAATADTSYTRTLLDGGASRMAKKFGEEAVELVIATLGGHRGEIAAEAADVVYHLLVLLQGAGVSLDTVVEELGRRTRQSGHAEKAARGR